jgi:hypothetical protein
VPTTMGAPHDFKLGFEALRDYVRRKPSQERCDLCKAAIPETHQHLLQPETRKLVCACDACAVLFTTPGSKYRRVPRRIRRIVNFSLPASTWDEFAIPINVVYFFEDTAAGRTKAAYPSPAGATESQLPLEAWRELTALNPILKSLEPDVETLLINRLAEPEYFLAPIDECYGLVGLIRSNWRGISGGPGGWQAVSEFFDSLRSRASSVVQEAHA